MVPVTDDEGLGRPLSVKEISDRAQAFEWNANIPFKHWLRTTQTLQQEADMYLRDHNFSQAYLLYLRYSTLVVDLLKTHPEYKKSPDARKELQKKFLTIDVVFRNLERIKPILEQQYNAWKKAESTQKTKPGHREQTSTGTPEGSPSYKQHASKDPALSYASRLLDAGENQDLAVELAQKEIQRRDATRKATKKNGEAHWEQQERRTAGFWENWTQDIAEQQGEDEEAFRKQMESTRRTLDQDTNLPPTNTRHTTDRPHNPPSVPSYSYPKLARSVPVEYSPQHLGSSEAPLSQPARPPKQEAARYYSPLVPERPVKTPHPSEPLAHLRLDNLKPQELPSRPPKLPDSQPEPPKKQQGVAFKPASYLENGEPIRPVFLPRQLRRQFLEIASENTKRGLEMCGILCGTAVNNALFVRCLLIPEQKCTSDTCETENEASMLDYCMEEDLLMLGWIHTHPTQTCFMSSRDLHTQSGYQIMLPESIAIVCAPKFRPSYGIFRLTNPPGLSHVLNCTQSSTFHAHSIDNLYTGAENPPGHVYEHDSLDFYVQDIRPGARNSAVPSKKF
ncbi:hypothetical protein E0Z10_g4958 [Xylaria hypoxylon]|uniref:MPN domain-containing protein n=1 Tax=Xylaria hypoxylon TaxID=37992 RepID=A0A4Z0YWQ1_9PEZI|nr:hypothetical protein E0Z10_g4958 [Xylaria hypoxylon]